MVWNIIKRQKQIGPLPSFLLSVVYRHLVTVAFGVRAENKTNLKRTLG
jgi:hypothetical protein